METIDAIKTRRSVRIFKDGDISKEQINTILSSAMLAPSAGNSQVWEFIIIDDKEILSSIPDIHPYSQMATSAQIGILVCADTSKEKHKGFWVQDCSAATQNILLSTHDLQLGAVWCGIHPKIDIEEKFSEKFNLPEPVRPLGLVLIGIPDMESKEVNRFDEGKIHWNKW